jgi:SET domain-containing protein
VRKFNNIEDMQKYRNGQNIKPMSTAESKKTFYNQSKIEDENNVKLAYKLSKQGEQAERANNEWWSKLRVLQ